MPEQTADSPAKHAEGVQAMIRDYARGTAAVESHLRPRRVVAAAHLHEAAETISALRSQLEEAQARLDRIDDLRRSADKNYWTAEMWADELATTEAHLQTAREALTDMAWPGCVEVDTEEEPPCGECYPCMASRALASLSGPVLPEVERTPGETT